MSRTVSEEARARARVLLASGLSTRQVAGQLGVSRQTVSRWTRDIARPCGGRPSGVDEDGIRRLRQEGASWRQVEEITGVPKSTALRRAGGL